MVRQLSLSGFEPAPGSKRLRNTHRYFFAVRPPPSIVALITQLTLKLCGKHQLRARPLLSKHLHCTMAPLGDYTVPQPEILDRAKEAANILRTPTFDVTFDHLLSFDRRTGKRPLVLQGGDGLIALKAFQQMLVDAIKRAGLGYQSDYKFTPHLTLLYDAQIISKQSIEPISWTVHEFVLIHSLLGQTRHETVERWELLEYFSACPKRKVDSPVFLDT